MRAFLLPAILAILLAGAASAQAHALLKTAEPPVASRVATAPAQLRLHFSEGVEPAFSGVEITGADGDGGPGAAKVATDPADPAVLIATPPAPLKPGIYRIHWHVVSVDTHKTEGTYQFEVTP